MKINLVNLVPLNGTNFATWKVQCKMALIRDGVWDIVNGTEIVPDSRTEIGLLAKYLSRKDRALATIVLSLEPSLLYLIGDPDDPGVVWKKLADQFQKTWANKLALRRRLYSLKLKEGDPVPNHIKLMTETFNELSVIGDSLNEEDRVVAEGIFVFWFSAQVNSTHNQDDLSYSIRISFPGSRNWRSCQTQSFSQNDLVLYRRPICLFLNSSSSSVDTMREPI